MLNSTVIPHILCGGSGTRLWPMSREAYPKQFAPLIQGKSLLTCTLERAAVLSDQLVCITNEAHRYLVDDAAKSANVTVQQILEPVARNTAAAMACAALLAQPGELLLFLPADHYIPDEEAFAELIEQGLPAAQQGAIVTFGVVPNFPSIAYGYIKQGAQLADAKGYQVSRFIEKPALDQAQKLLLEGDNLWNAGIFLVSRESLIAAFEKNASDILSACHLAVQNAKLMFGHTLLDKTALDLCRNESIDYAVLETHDQVVVVPFNGAWSDVGSWTAVAQLQSSDADGNRIDEYGYAIECKNIFVRGLKELQKPVVALGMENTIIVDTPDALLVANVTHAEKVKDVVKQLKLDGAEQVVKHRKVARPWGDYDSIDQGERYQVKRITVKPGQKLSLQMHHHRAEHWIVVKGTAKVTKGSEEILLTENQSTYIPLGVVHRLENVGKIDLEMIEVQSGSYLGEDDIVRFEDGYGRI